MTRKPASATFEGLTPSRTRARYNRNGQPGKIYVLWGEGTTRFKIGFTAQLVGGKKGRAAIIATNSPIPLRVMGSRFGTRSDETALHALSHIYRVHGEWFSLPERVVWGLLRWLGDYLQVPEDVDAMDIQAGLRFIRPSAHEQEAS